MVPLLKQLHSNIICCYVALRRPGLPQITAELRAAGADWGDQVQIGDATVTLVQSTTSSSTTMNTADDASGDIVDTRDALSDVDGRTLQKGSRSKAQRPKQRIKAGAP